MKPNTCSKKQTNIILDIDMNFMKVLFPWTCHTCHSHNSSLIASAKRIIHSHVLGLNSTHQLSCNVALVPTGAIHHIIILIFLSKSWQPSSEPLPFIQKYFTSLYHIRILLHTHTRTRRRAQACVHTHTHTSMHTHTHTTTITTTHICITPGQPVKCIVSIKERQLHC